MAKARKTKAELIDFSGVPEDIQAGGGVHIPEGDYLGKIVKVEKRWKDDDRNNVPYFSWEIQVNDGQHKGKKLRLTTSLKPEALFNLRNLIFAATGKNVAGTSKFKFDPQKLIGKQVGMTVEDNEYKDKKGKTRVGSAVAATFPKSELEEEDEEELEDEDEEDEEDEEEEKEEDDEDEEDEEDELEGVDVDEL